MVALNAGCSRRPSLAAASSMIAPTPRCSRRPLPSPPTPTGRSRPRWSRAVPPAASSRASRSGTWRSAGPAPPPAGRSGSARRRAGGRGSPSPPAAPQERTATTDAAARSSRPAARSASSSTRNRVPTCGPWRSTPPTAPAGRPPGARCRPTRRRACVTAPATATAPAGRPTSRCGSGPTAPSCSRPRSSRWDGGLHRAPHRHRQRRAQGAATVRAIYVAHTVAQGFGDIGYHLLVDQQGGGYEGRWSGADPMAGDRAARRPPADRATPPTCGFAAGAVRHRDNAERAPRAVGLQLLRERRGRAARRPHVHPAHAGRPRDSRRPARRALRAHPRQPA